MPFFAPKQLAVALTIVLGTAAGGAAAQVPAGYPGNYQGVVDAAKKEGKLIVYSTTDTGLVRPLIKDFESLYGVKVEYNDMISCLTAFTGVSSIALSH